MQAKVAQQSKKVPDGAKPESDSEDDSDDDDDDDGDEDGSDEGDEVRQSLEVLNMCHILFTRKRSCLNLQRFLSLS